MVDLESRLAQAERELAAIKEKVSFFNVIYGKFDETLAKVQEMMEDRRSETNDDLKDVYKKIEDTEARLLKEMQNIRAEMKQQHEIEHRKIEDLNRWRWFTVGGATVIGFLISKLFSFFK